jgi:hypothetical protein
MMLQNAEETPKEKRDFMKFPFFALSMALIAGSSGWIEAQTSKEASIGIISQASARESAAKLFREGKEVYLFNLTPNPLTLSRSTFSPPMTVTVSFIRSTTATVSLKNLKIGFWATPSTFADGKELVFGGKPTTLQSALKFSGEHEGTITFEVNRLTWSVGSARPGQPLKLLLVSQQLEEASNVVELSTNLQ